MHTEYSVAYSEYTWVLSKYSLHSASSDPSGQSLWVSHAHSIGMHSPDTHMNWLATQVLTEAAG